MFILRLMVGAYMAGALAVFGLRWCRSPFDTFVSQLGHPNAVSVTINCLARVLKCPEDVLDEFTIVPDGPQMRLGLFVFLLFKLFFIPVLSIIAKVITITMRIIWAIFRSVLSFVGLI
jgi:hypothetical protein